MKSKFYIKQKNYRGFLISTIPITVMCIGMMIGAFVSGEYGLMILISVVFALPLLGYFVPRSKGNLDKFVLDESGITIIRGIKKEIAHYPWDNLKKLVKTNMSGTVSLQLRITDDKGNNIKIHTDNMEKFREAKKAFLK